MVEVTDLQDALKSRSKMQVDLVVNDNRTTMIRILEKRKKYVRLSIHRMFLGASNPVIEAVADYIQNQRNPSSSALLQDYINKQLPLFAYHEKLDLSKLITLGETYNLKILYDELNQTYFNNALDLSITWYGLPCKRTGLEMTYGLYYDPLKLIKIHRLLDRQECPEFYVSFVIYHEMLHNIHKPLKGEHYTHIHTPEFKAHEKLFKHYHEAMAWEKKSRHLFFK